MGVGHRRTLPWRNGVGKELGGWGGVGWGWEREGQESLVHEFEEVSTNGLRE